MSSKSHQHRANTHQNSSDNSDDEKSDDDEDNLSEADNDLSGLNSASLQKKISSEVKSPVLLLYIDTNFFLNSAPAMEKSTRQ
jgi:hypothetical protein